jgi:hypothetical protein
VNLGNSLDMGDACVRRVARETRMMQMTDTANAGGSANKMQGHKRVVGAP